MAPSSGELYGHPMMPSRFEVDCLLPNGIIITLDNVIRHATLKTIKDDLWAAARDYPLYQVGSLTKFLLFFSKVKQSGKGFFSEFSLLSIRTDDTTERRHDKLRNCYYVMV